MSHICLLSLYTETQLGTDDQDKNHHHNFSLNSKTDAIIKTLKHHQISTSLYILLFTYIKLIYFEIAYLSIVEAPKSPKQKQISISILLLTLWMGTATTLWLCGSVDINNIMWCRAIMHGFYNYSGTSPVSWLQPSDGAAPCCALKTQPVGVSSE